MSQSRTKLTALPHMPEPAQSNESRLTMLLGDWSGATAAALAKPVRRRVAKISKRILVVGSVDFASWDSV